MTKIDKFEFLKTLKLDTPVSLVPGDTISVQYKGDYGPYKELIKHTITGTHYFKEVGIFDCTVDDRYAIGGILIEGVTGPSEKSPNGI